MAGDEKNAARPRPATDAIERLYVYWFISTALLTVALVAVVLMMRSMLDDQAATIGVLHTRVQQLEQTHAPAQPAPAESASPADPPQPTAPDAADAENERSDAEASPPPPRVVVPSEDALRTQLADATAEVLVTPADIVDVDAAQEALRLAARHLERAAWSAPTWARLAVVARLMGRNSTAEALAERAAAGGDPLIDYYTVSTRAALAQGNTDAALRMAMQLAERSAGTVTARALEGLARLAAGEVTDADRLLTGLTTPATLALYDRFLVARGLLTLERWDAFQATVATMDDVPRALTAEYNFLYAVAAARSGDTTPALAILDGLLAELPPGARPERLGPAANRGWSWPTPDRYEVEVWRGVTLLRGGQMAAARDVLEQAAQQQPGRAAAHYQLGLLAARAGERDAAIAHLQSALACAAREAPVWEALALLKIDAEDIPAALEDLDRAVAINARRGSAHFLRAIAYAKLSQRDPAAESLAAAFRLEPRYREEAGRTGVITRLFSDAELDALARGEDGADA
jgi:tetratricopeptide (TPR) repeat protein